MKKLFNSALKGLSAGIALLVMLFVTAGTVVFGFWAVGIIGDDDQATATVAIDEGQSVTTTVTVADESDTTGLVPVGYTGTNDVDLDFTIVWGGSGAVGATGVVSVSVDAIEVSGTDVSSLFTVDASATPTIIAGTDLVYTINVEFTNEPLDATQYNLVANQTLEVTLTFTVSPN